MHEEIREQCTHTVPSYLERGRGLTSALLNPCSHLYSFSRSSHVCRRGRGIPTFLTFYRCTVEVGGGGAQRIGDSPAHRCAYSHILYNGFNADPDPDPDPGSKKWCGFKRILVLARLCVAQKVEFLKYKYFLSGYYVLQSYLGLGLLIYFCQFDCCWIRTRRGKSVRIRNTFYVVFFYPAS
jgi:hypothetical protein